MGLLIDSVFLSATRFSSFSSYLCRSSTLCVLVIQDGGGGKWKVVVGGGWAELPWYRRTPFFVTRPMFFWENGSEFAPLALCATCLPSSSSHLLPTLCGHSQSIIPFWAVFSCTFSSTQPSSATWLLPPRPLWKSFSILCHQLQPPLILRPAFHLPIGLFPWGSLFSFWFSMLSIALSSLPPPPQHPLPHLTTTVPVTSWSQSSLTPASLFPYLTCCQVLWLLPFQCL